MVTFINQPAMEHKKTNGETLHLVHSTMFVVSRVHLVHVLNATGALLLLQAGRLRPRKRAGEPLRAVETSTGPGICAAVGEVVQ